MKAAHSFPVEVRNRKTDLADLTANVSISSFYAVMNLQKSLLSKLIKLCIQSESSLELLQGVIGWFLILHAVPKTFTLEEE